MEIRDGGIYGASTRLDSISGATEASRVHVYVQEEQTDRDEASSIPGQDWATLSHAGNQAVQAAGDAGVRQDKVAAVRAALTAGTYAVPASTVATHAIGAMLGQGI